MLVREIRDALDILLSKKIADPDFDITQSALISAIATLVQTDGNV